MNDQLKLREFLVNVLVRYIESKGYTQEEAAQRLDTNLSRINCLMRRRLELFGLNSLFKLCEKAGFKIYDTVIKACGRFIK